MVWPARHVSVSIPHPPAAVIAVAGDPARLPEWAAGLAAGIRLDQGRWVADSPFGTVEVAFVGPVELGILDHDVTLPHGEVVHNPLRVLRNDHGSEVVFTVFRRRGMTESAWHEDIAAIQADLLTLAELIGR